MVCGSDRARGDGAGVSDPAAVLLRQSAERESKSKSIVIEFAKFFTANPLLTRRPFKALGSPAKTGASQAMRPTCGRLTGNQHEDTQGCGRTQTAAVGCEQVC